MAFPILMPKLGMVMVEGTIGKWFKPPGQWVSQGEVVAEIETEKITYELEATRSGVFQPVVAEGDTIPVEGLIGYLLERGEPMPQVAKPTAPPPPALSAAPTQAVPSPTARAEVRASPGARKLASSLGINVALVPPTGPGGRVVEADVTAYAQKREQAQSPAAPPGLPAPSKAAPLKGMRKAIAGHMRASLASTAQLSFFLEVDVTEAVRLRREASKKGEATLTTAHVLIKACAEALRRHPELNTILHQGHVLYFDEVNIGVAVALSDGLIVPVVKQVDRKDIHQVAQETQELASRAREGKLKADEVVGGTFTVSVLGTVDGFTPILNQGQSAILGAGRPLEKPAVKDGQVVVREMMTLSLTVDHQVIDGAVAASFLRRLQQIIERPAPLFKS